MTHDDMETLLDQVLDSIPNRIEVYPEEGGPEDKQQALLINTARLVGQVKRLERPDLERKDWSSEQWVDWQRNVNPLLPKHGLHIARLFDYDEGEPIEIKGVVFSLPTGTRQFVAGNWLCPGTITIQDGVLYLATHRVEFIPLERKKATT